MGDAVGLEEVSEVGAIRQWEPRQDGSRCTSGEMIEVYEWKERGSDGMKTRY